MLRDKSIRPERPTRELTAYFLSYDPRSSRYRMTRYWEDFATLILGKVRGAMNPESLKLIFRNTFQLREGDQVSWPPNYWTICIWVHVKIIDCE